MHYIIKCDSPRNKVPARPYAQPRTQAILGMRLLYISPRFEKHTFCWGFFKINAGLMATGEDRFNCSWYSLSLQILSIVLIVVVGNFATKNVSIGVWFITGVTAVGALLTCTSLMEIHTYILLVHVTSKMHALPLFTEYYKNLWTCINSRTSSTVTYVSTGSVY